MKGWLPVQSSLYPESNNVPITVRNVLPEKSICQAVHDGVAASVLLGVAAPILLPLCPNESFVYINLFCSHEKIDGVSYHEKKQVFLAIVIGLATFILFISKCDLGG